MKLALAAKAASDAGAVAPLRDAAQIASAYRSGWADDFLQREVNWFASVSRERRLARMAADSLRREGNDALNSDGVPAAMRHWRRSLEMGKRSGSPMAIAPILVSIAGGFYREGRSDSASIYARRGLAEAKAHGDRRTMGNAVGLLGSLARDAGDAAEAMALYRRASEIRNRAGDLRGVAADHNNIALILRERGELDSATVALNSAAQINRLLGRSAVLATNLSNMGAIAADRGDLLVAGSQYRAAIRIHRSERQQAELPFVLADYGRVQARQGDYSAALASLLEARALHESTGAYQEAAVALAEAAELHAAMGDMGLALAAIDGAERHAVKNHLSRAVSAELAITRAELGVKVGAYNEAASRSRLAQRLYEEERDPTGIARSLHQRALIEYLRGQARFAMELANDALRIEEELGDTRAAASTRLLLASLQHSVGDAKFRQSIEVATTSLRRDGDKTAEATANNLLGELLLAQDSRAAERAFRAGLRVLGAASAPEVAWRLHAGLGRVLLKAGFYDSARASLTRSVGLIEQTSSRMWRPSDRYGFLHDKWSVYEDLAKLAVRKGDAELALATVERMRARRLVEALRLDGRSSHWPGDPSKLLAEIRSRLRDDELVLEYLTGDSASSVFAISRTGIQTISLRANRKTLASIVDLARRGMERPVSGDTAQPWKPPLARLYRELILPVESRGLLAGKRHLIIVPNAELNYLSFAALIRPGREDRFLVDLHDISYAPSATTWIQLNRSPRVARQVVAGFAPHMSRLPASGKEVRALRRIYGAGARVVEGPRATASLLRSYMDSASILHLATFGVLNRVDPLSSFVSLSAGDGKDARFTVTDVLDTRIRGQLIVLSGCETGLGGGIHSSTPAGEDWVGLMHGFLQSGASGVVASLWPVDDGATARLMTAFHVRLKTGQPPAAALAGAQRDIKKDNRRLAPFYWAAFTFNGDSGLHGATRQALATTSR